MNVLKKQRRGYSGKKKRHTQKAQLVVDKTTRRVICTAFIHGRRHDFRLFKESKVCFRKEVVCVADTGYQGMLKLHANIELPKKKSRKRPLAREDVMQNRWISSVRITVENIIREVKISGLLLKKPQQKKAIQSPI